MPEITPNIESLPSTRKAALESGAPQYFTGKPCSHGHIAPRWAAGNCIVCQKKTHLEYRRRKGQMAAPRIDESNLLGSTHGFWKIISVEEERDKHGHLWAQVICILCNAASSRVVVSQLLRGDTQSCRSCAAKRSAARHKNAGLRAQYPEEYHTWANAKHRCRNPKNSSWPRYGGRGITFSDEWDDFRVFLADMGLKPGPKHSLGRIDNDAGYCKENCQWELARPQSRNRENTIRISWEGQKIALTQICENLGLDSAFIRSTAKRMGISYQEAFEKEFDEMLARPNYWPGLEGIRHKMASLSLDPDTPISALDKPREPA